MEVIICENKVFVCSLYLETIYNVGSRISINPKKKRFNTIELSNNNVLKFLVRKSNM